MTCISFDKENRRIKLPITEGYRNQAFPEPTVSKWRRSVAVATRRHPLRAS